MTSSASSNVSGGRMPATRLAIIVLPEPGGPASSTLWPPAAAISSARRASGLAAHVGEVAVPATPGGRRRRGSDRTRDRLRVVERVDRFGERVHRVEVEAARRRPLRCALAAGSRSPRKRRRAARPRRSAAPRARPECRRRATARPGPARRPRRDARRRRRRPGCRARSAGRTRRRPCGRRPARG